MKGRRWIVSLNWAWGGVSAASGLLVTVVSGWTLLHAYTPLFFMVLGIFGLSLLIVPSSLMKGLWEWRKGRIDRRAFTVEFLLPQLLVGAGFCIAYIAEELRYH